MENGFLSNEDKVSPILEFLEQVRHDLNSNGVCNIAMGTFILLFSLAVTLSAHVLECYSGQRNGLRAFKTGQI